MTPEEIVYYCTYHCKKNNINPEFFSVFNNAIVVRDPGCNDLSKPGFALVYNFTNNTVALAKIGNTWQPIVGNTPRIIKVDTVKDLETFLKFIGFFNKYCKEHHCDYKTVLDKETVPVLHNKDDNQEKGPRYVVFDKDGKTVFMYHDNKIECVKKLKNDSFVGVIPDDIGSISFGEFEKFIKDNRTVIDKIVDKQMKEYEKQKLERIRNANRNFDKSVSEVKMNGKPKRTDKGI